MALLVTRRIERYKLVEFINIAYAYDMKRLQQFNRGFTIVEVIIVIIVLGILAGIAVAGWNGVTTGSRDRARDNDLRAWMSSFDTYKGRFIVYPVVPAGDGAANAKTVCLGKFDDYNNKCGQYNSSTATAYVNALASGQSVVVNELARIGNEPSNNGPDIKAVLAGPIVYMTQTTTSGVHTVTSQFINFFENACPTGYTNINASLPSTIALVRTSLPAGTTANVCSITKTFTYGP